MDGAVKTLLALKADYKVMTGKDWKPGCHTSNAPVASTPSPAVVGEDVDAINTQIVEQGDKVRQLKSQKADKVGLLF